MLGLYKGFPWGKLPRKRVMRVADGGGVLFAIVLFRTIFTSTCHPERSHKEGIKLVSPCFPL